MVDRRFSVSRRVLLTLIVALNVAIPQLVLAQENEETDETAAAGSRRAPRSVTDSAVPIDVIGGDDLTAQGSTDMDDLLRGAIPSYNVNAQPISDEATIVRPANLRGLSPDSMLVLVNGKRLHRAAAIALMGGGVADGSQGPDLASIPGLALKQVEILRDGASAQYGSDAIAGVINFVLRDNGDGALLEARYGETFDGDGPSSQIGINWGLPLTEDGFFNFTATLNDVDPTVRSVQRSDAATLVAAGNTAVASPAQIWGTPEIKQDFKLWANAGLDLGNGREAYTFANWSERDVEGGGFFRNPNTHGGVFNGPINPMTGNDTIAVADLTFGPTDDGIPCPVVDIVGLIPDPAALASVAADPNCFAFNQIAPGGFTPRFGGHVADASITAGTRGELSNGMRYDISASYGRNSVDYAIDNTVNPQLAAFRDMMPRDFELGSYIQSERNVNLDVSWPIEVGNFASSLSVAAGLEYRVGQFEIKAGSRDSFFIDTRADLFAQGFGIGSNGFPGFKPEDAGTFDRGSVAVYVDLEADVTENFLFGVAARYEYFDDFGDTNDAKVAALFRIAKSFAIRGSASTGFRAPTVGQSNVRRTTTVFTNGVLADDVLLPPTNPVAVQKGGVELQPEESTNLTLGVITGLGPIDLTVDYFNIEVEDRIALTATQVLTPQDITDLLALGIVDASNLTGVRFLANAFDTTSEGVDLVASWRTESLGGDTDFSLRYNYTDTTVDSFDPTIIGPTRVRQLEENLPDTRVVLSAVHNRGDWRALLRVNYFGDYYEAHLNDGGLPIEAGAETTVDCELGYSLTEKLNVTVGASNLFDETPDDNPWATIVGAQYPSTSPMGFNGGVLYVRANWQID